MTLNLGVLFRCIWVVCEMVYVVDLISQEREVALQVIGMKDHTLLKKWRPCCSRGRKQLWRGREPCHKLFPNRFQFHFHPLECVLLSFWNWEFSRLIGCVWHLSRFGGMVGHHQLEMKRRWKRDRNGLTGGWRRSRGRIGEELPLIKEIPLRQWKLTQLSLIHI